MECPHLGRPMALHLEFSPEDLCAPFYPEDLLPRLPPPSLAVLGKILSSSSKESPRQ